MDWMLLVKAAIMGLVEGFTEFLPISSTGHLILVGTLLDFHDERGKLFEIVIQSGAILAICWEYRQRLADRLAGVLKKQAEDVRFFVNLIIAFLPLAILGLLFGKYIKAALFNPITVASTFILGGLIILWAEKRQHTVRIHRVEDLQIKDAIKLGLAQALALIPGTSRSGSTIIGGLLFGLSRPAATEFSFFLAIPTLGLASVYQLYKERHLLVWDDLGMWVVGFVSAFLSAFLCVRWLLRYVATHDFTWFAWYRIAFGALILLTAHFGWVQWVD